MAVEYNLQEALAATIEIVNRRLRKSFEQEYFLFNLFMRVPKQMTNQKGARFPVNTDPNVSINWRKEGGLLPPGDTSKDKEYRIFFARPAISRRLTGDVMDLDKQDVMLKSMTDGLKRDYETIKKEINQQMYGNGRGTKGIVQSVAGAVVTLKRPLGATQFYSNQRCWFYNPADGAARSTTDSVITQGGVDKAARTITLTANAPAGVAEDDVVTWPDSYLNSITGLAALVNNNNDDFQGLDRAKHPSTKSPMVDAAGGLNSLSRIDQQELMVGFRGGEIETAKDHIYVTSLTQVQRYRDLGRNYQEYKSGTSFDGGNGGINNQTPNGRKIWSDVDCPEDIWYLLYLPGFIMCEFAPLSVMNKDGKEIRMIPGYSSAGEGSHLDAYIYYIGMKFDIGLLEPETCSAIINLGTTGLTSPHFN